jgi:hypothetical protein
MAAYARDFDASAFVGTFVKDELLLPGRQAPFQLQRAGFFL